jgi:hypothetical protein
MTTTAATTTTPTPTRTIASTVFAELNSRWFPNDDNDDHDDLSACKVYVSTGRRVERVPILRR